MQLVLLPGLDGTGTLFKWIEPELAQLGVRGVRVESYPLTGGQDHAAHASRLVPALGPGPVTVLGESYSGPIAVELAARRPDVVKAVILVGTFLEAPWRPWLLRLGALCDHRWAPLWTVRTLMLGRSGHVEAAAELGRVVDAAETRIVAERLRALAAVDVRSLLDKVDCPMLVLHGTRDRLVSPAPIVEALSPRAKTVVKLLPAPHMVLQTVPREAALEIASFLRGLYEVRT